MPFPLVVGGCSAVGLAVVVLTSDGRMSALTKALYTSCSSKIVVTVKKGKKVNAGAKKTFSKLRVQAARGRPTCR